MTSRLLSTPATHSWSLTGLAEKAWTTTTGSLYGAGSGPLCRVAEAGAVAVLRNITEGSLHIYTPDQHYAFPEKHSPDSSSPAEIHVRNPTFWLRLATMGDLGFAESYMFGDIDCDLIKVFSVFLKNKSRLSSIQSSWLTRLFATPTRITSSRFINSTANTRANISAHYDLSNEMFVGFLSKDMTYSCGIYADLDADLQPSTPSTLSEYDDKVTSRDTKPRIEGDENEDPLYAAQMRKLHHLIRKADIRPGHRVLEIGSGWGSMAMLITSSVPGTTVDTLTLSVHQQTLARQRILEAGLQDRVTVHLMDYRHMPEEWKGKFDRVVSCEMIEAVGIEFLPTYWKMIDFALNEKTGAGCIQAITIPEARFADYASDEDFIRKWIFPGGILPTVELLVQSMAKGTQGRLVTESMCNIGPHYARTLRDWRIRFEDKFEEVIVPALKNQYPDVMNGPSGEEEIEVFRRKWVYYFCYCEIGFSARVLGDHIVSFTREGSTSFGCHVYD